MLEPLRGASNKIDRQKCTQFMHTFMHYVLPTSNAHLWFADFFVHLSQEVVDLRLASASITSPMHLLLTPFEFFVNNVPPTVLVSFS